MAFVTEKGSVLLNPSERSRKYAIEMKYKIALTNDGHEKTKDNKPVHLTKEQLAFRAGYLEHQKDSNRAFKAKHLNYKRKTR